MFACPCDPTCSHPPSPVPQRFERVRPHAPLSDPHPSTTLPPSMRLRWGGPGRAAGSWQLAQMHPLAPSPPLSLGWGLLVLLSLCCCFALLRLILSLCPFSPACDFVRCPCLAAAAPAAAVAAAAACCRALPLTGCPPALAPDPPAVLSCLCVCNHLQPHTPGKNLNRTEELYQWRFASTVRVAGGLQLGEWFPGPRPCCCTSAIREGNREPHQDGQGMQVGQRR